MRKDLRQQYNLTVRYATTYVDEWNRKNHERSEEQVYTVTHSLEHLRGEPGDQEGEEPVGGSNEGLRSGPNVGRENFSSVNPWLKKERSATPHSARSSRTTYCTVPCGTVEDCPEVEEEHGNDTTRAQLVGDIFRLGGLSDSDVGTDGEH